MSKLRFGNYILILLCLLLPKVLLAQAQPIPVYTSPIVNSDRTVEFNLYAPKAEKVTLLGAFQADGIVLTKTGNGLWSATIGPLPPEIYHYQFDVDGVKIMDTKNQSPYPWLDGKSELIVPGTPPLLHETMDVPHGTLHNHIYNSATTGNPNRVRVYTPPNYDPLDDHEYPVLFLLHGFGEKVSFWSDFGKINLIVDNLISQDKIIAPIIVMPNADPLEAEYYKFFSAQFDGNAWMEENMELLNQDLHNDLIPFLKNRYKIKWDKQSMAISGSSMGGIQAIILGVRNVNEFGWIIGLSTSLNIPPFDAEYFDQINKLPLFQLNIGQNDEWGFAQSNKVHKWLMDHNVKHEYVISNGGHDWDVWRKDMIKLLPKLFR